MPIALLRLQKFRVNFQLAVSMRFFSIKTSMMALDSDGLIALLVATPALHAAYIRDPRVAPRPAGSGKSPQASLQPAKRLVRYPRFTFGASTGSIRSALVFFGELTRVLTS